MTTYTKTAEWLTVVDANGINYPLSVVTAEDILLPYVPTQAEIVAQLESAIQTYIDSKAQAKGYDSANSCISYLNSSNTVWKTDATSMNTWRDAVWTAAYTDQASAAPSTTWNAVLAILPASPW